MKERTEYLQLRKMGKNELIRLLEAAEKENRELADQKQQLERKAAEYEARLAEKDRQIEETQRMGREPGTLADSMIQVNGVMEAAQRAAEQYLENIREMEAAKQSQADAIIKAAQQRAERIVVRAKEGAEQVKEASSNVLQNLQAEVGRLLDNARGIYERNSQVPGAEEYIDRPQESAGEAQCERVPRLADILNGGAQEAQEKPAEAAHAAEPDESRGALRETAGESLPDVKAEPQDPDQFAAGLREEIKNVIDDLTDKTKSRRDT